MRLLTSLTAAALILSAPAFAGSHASAYSAGDLIAPCQEADNDAREAGTRAETECEQYIRGFIDALMTTGQAGPGTTICTPEQNTADEVRWAFMRWVYGDFSKRKAMTAAEAIYMTLESDFPCGG